MSDTSVRPINKEILGMEGNDNLIQQTIPSIPIINTALFRAGDKSNVLSFAYAPATIGRLGIFAAKKNTAERAVIMLLPQSGRPDGVLICLTQQFRQAGGLANMQWENPLLPEFVHYALLKHVINRWGAQMLASQRNLALMYILRAKGSSAADELGPFKNDGKFVVDVMRNIAELTNNAFTPDKVEAFTFSSGIFDFNNFLSGLSKHIQISGVYNIDPDNSLMAANPSGGRIKQYASGAVGGFLPMFEPMPLERWVNEDKFLSIPPEFRLKPDPRNGYIRQYLHNTVMPAYSLYLGLKSL
jgi:hypothetical protein